MNNKMANYDDDWCSKHPQEVNQLVICQICHTLVTYGDPVL